MAEYLIFRTEYNLWSNEANPKAKNWEEKKKQSASTLLS